MTQKIHFINRIDKTNVGDMTCCPLNYFPEYFLQYSVLRHDLDFIDWRTVQRDDVVIIGGGGMLNVTPSFNAAINRLLDRCTTVIGWSLGHNTHNRRWSQSDSFEPIDYGRFALIAIRDFKHPSGLEWLPCPSCLAPELETTSETKRKFGYVAHKDLTSVLPSGDHLDNSFDLDEIIKYVCESEVIATNSYHIAYWAQLMRRKAIVVNKFSDKFDYFKYPVGFIDTGDAAIDPEALEAASSAVNIYKDARTEAVALNDAFFQRVKKIVEAKGVERGDAYQVVYQLTDAKSWNMQNDIRGANSKYNDLSMRFARENDETRTSMHDLHKSFHQRLDREGEILHDRITDREREILQRVELNKQSLSDTLERLFGQIAMMQRRIDELESRALIYGAGSRFAESDPKSN